MSQDIYQYLELSDITVNSTSELLHNILQFLYYLSLLLYKPSVHRSYLSLLLYKSGKSGCCLASLIGKHRCKGACTVVLLDKHPNRPINTALIHVIIANGIEAPMRFLAPKGGIDPGVMYFRLPLCVLFDGQLFPLTAKVQKFQNIAEDRVQGELWLRATAPHMQVGKTNSSNFSKAKCVGIPCLD